MRQTIEKRVAALKAGLDQFLEFEAPDAKDYHDALILLEAHIRDEADALESEIFHK